MDIFNYIEKEKNIFLNSQQKNAVVSENHAALILAVPGSGKTTVLVTRIAHLILNRGISANKILTITFGKESSRDMERRFLYLFGELITTMPKFSTIHSFCYSVMRSYCKSLQRAMPVNIETGEIKPNKSMILRQIYAKINENEYIGDESLDTLSTEISFVKNMMFSREEIEKFDSENKNFFEVFFSYEKFKKENSFMDFDDMLLYSYDILSKFPHILDFWKKTYSVINVDEAQDTSRIQHAVIRLFSKNTDIFMVGDEDQSIYAFRGAYPNGILNFTRDYPDGVVYKMEQNFRSSFEIVDRANLFIKHNMNRYDKNMFCNNKISNCVRIKNLRDFSMQYSDVLKEIESTEKNQSVAVIYRNNESALPFVDYFENAGIPYLIREHKPYFFNSYVVKDMRNFMRLSYDSSNADAFKEIYYKLFISKKQYEYAIENTKKGGCFFETLYKSNMCEKSFLYKLKKYMKIFPMLKQMQSFKMLRSVEDDIGYKNNLFSKLKGHAFESANQKLNILKTIANGHTENEKYWSRLDFIEKTVRESNCRDKDTRITLTTAHSCKGLEFDRVFIVDLIDGQFPGQNAIDAKYDKKPALFEEEMRLFYVAFTRAKKDIILYSADKLNGVPIKPSRFIGMCTTKEKNIQIAPEKSRKPYAEHEWQDKKDYKNPENFISENHVGKTIIHNYFGEGVIIKGNGEFATIKFKYNGNKELSLGHCLQNKIIRFVK